MSLLLQRNPGALSYKSSVVLKVMTFSDAFIVYAHGDKNNVMNIGFYILVVISTGQYVNFANTRP